jgi:hypothetical protein
MLYGKASFMGFSVIQYVNFVSDGKMVIFVPRNQEFVHFCWQRNP